MEQRQRRAPTSPDDRAKEEHATECAPRSAGWRSGETGLYVVSGLLAITGLAVTPFLRRFSGAPYVASTAAARRAVGERMRLHAAGRTGGGGVGRRGMRVVDLGSGSGEMVMDAAREGFLAEGYERNMWLVLLSRWRAWRQGFGRSAGRRGGDEGTALFHWRDLWKADLKDVDVVVVFGVPGMMQRLGDKLSTELSPGALVCSNSFPVPLWTEAGRRRNGVSFYIIGRTHRQTV